ncbi:zinc-binding protein A33-like [Lissotriton helveticus]
MHQPPEEGAISNSTGSLMTQEEPRWTVHIGEECLCFRQEDDTWYFATITVIRRNEEDGKVDFYVHYSGSDPALEQWVDASCLVPTKYVGDIISIEGDQNMIEPLHPKKRVMVVPKQAQQFFLQEKPKVSMQKRESNKTITFQTEKSDVSEMVTCPICQECLRDPVLLECGHNICAACVGNIWSDKENLSCPKCGTIFKEKKITSNRALAKLIQKIVVSCTQQGDELAVCKEHREKMKLFCKEDGELVCAFCCNSRKEQSRTFLPIDQAVDMYRAQLTTAAPHVKSQLAELRSLTAQQEQKISEHKATISDMKGHISEEFSKLHAFLHDREKDWIQQLNEEGNAILMEMEEYLHRVREELQNMEKTLLTLQSKLEQQDATLFLKEIKSFAEKCCHDEVECTPVKFVVAKELNCGCFKGPIQYTVWKEMKSAVSPGIASMKLNPDTAHPSLFVSEDRTSVRYTSSKRLLPDNQQRLSRRLGVLGQAAIVSGKHYWEVVVGHISGCDIGVVSESIYRKGYFSFCPMDGCWMLSLRNETKFVTLDSGTQMLTQSERPQRIGVYLNYEEGQLSFYNAERMSHLYTFRFPFAGNLYPYIGHANLATHGVPLQIFCLKM